jgi:hypothetical protein
MDNDGETTGKQVVWSNADVEVRVPASALFAYPDINGNPW